MPSLVAASWPLIAVLALAAGLRLFNLGEHSLWYDEQVSSLIAVGVGITQPMAPEGHPFTPRDFWSHNTLSSVVRTTINDGGNNLAYNVLLHYWSAAFGSSDFLVRLPSAIFGVLIVFVIYRLALNLASHRVAILAAALASLHPFLIRYSQEARSYSLATLCTLIASVIFWKLIHSRDDTFALLAGVAYGLMAGISLLCHYLTTPIFIGHAVYGVVFVRNRQAWCNCILAAVIASALFGAWMIAGGREGLARIATVNREYQDRSSDPHEKFALRATPKHVAAGWAQCLLVMSGNMMHLAGYRISRLAVFLGIPFALLLWCRGQPQQAVASQAALAWLAILAVASLAFSTVLAIRAGHVISFQPLYHIFCIPYITILLAISISHGWALGGSHRFAVCCFAAMQCALMSTSIVLVYLDSPWRRPRNEYPTIARQIARRWAPGDVVTFASCMDNNLTNLHLRDNLEIVQKINTRQTSPIEWVGDR